MSSPRRKSLMWSLALFGIALGVYCRTLAPTITWRNDSADSGDLVTAAVVGGIPHPPGYPLYTLIAGVGAQLPLGEPARGVAFCSALAAAGATVAFFFAARAVAGVDWIAASVALTFAFAPLVWAQAIIAEVYALNLLLVAALLAVTLADHPRRLFFAAAIFGAGLAHHFSILLLAPTAVILLGDTVWTRKQIFGAGAALLAPLGLYLVLPMRALAQPPINWGDPRTLENFWWTVSATPYRAYWNFAPGDLLARAAMTARLLFAQFNVWGVALGLWGGAEMAFARAARTRRRVGALALGYALTLGYALIYATRDSYVYLLPAFAIFALGIAFGIGFVFDQLTRARRAWLVRALVVLALAFCPAWNLAANFAALDLSQDREATTFAASVLADAPRDAVIVARGDQQLFALWYQRYVLARATSQVIVVSEELLQYDWYFDQMRRLIPGVSAAIAPHARLDALLAQARRAGRGVYPLANDSPGAGRK